jgi:3-keto-disaccharide hydrolase
MKAHLVVTAFVLFLSGVSAQGVIPAPEGFTDLLSGKDLAGWWGAKTEDPETYLALDAAALRKKVEDSVENIRQHWRMENGVLINDGKGMFLTTRKNYGDFELRVDYRTVARADSGIYLRGIPQVQIWDHTEKSKFRIGADKGSGGLWNNRKGAAGKDPLVMADKPFGEWNRFRIIMVGERVTVFLNSKLVVDHARLENYFKHAGKKRKNLPKMGPIQLQTHGGEISWRNVFIREIGAAEGNEILGKGGYGDPGFRQVFNGKNWKGWKGPTQNYKITNAGALRCKKGKGGTIFTEAEYGDFVAHLRIKLPVGGNNGLAIRYPGKGDTAYAGMCELQVLDNTAPKYAKLRPQQYHGSVYGQVAARRGFLRPPGTWNFQAVTVRGSSIRVELNGYVIVDADILKDGDYMTKKDKFKGRGRKKGHFGFAGHGDPVEFRDVRIKKL